MKCKFFQQGGELNYYQRPITTSGYLLKLTTSNDSTYLLKLVELLQGQDLTTEQLRALFQTIESRSKKNINSQPGNLPSNRGLNGNSSDYPKLEKIQEVLPQHPFYYRQPTLGDGYYNDYKRPEPESTSLTYGTNMPYGVAY